MLLEIFLRFAGQLGFERSEFGFAALRLRVVLAEVDVAFLQLGFEARDVGLEAVDQRVLHDFGEGFGAAGGLTAVAVGGLPLDDRELGGKLVELGSLVVKAFFGGDEAGLQAIAGERLLGGFELVAQGLGLASNHAAFWRAGSTLAEVDVDVGLGEGVGGRRAKAGSAPLKLMLMTLLSREGFTSSFFCSRLASQTTMLPFPSVSSCHCSLMMALSSMCSILTTRWATRSRC